MTSLRPNLVSRINRLPKPATVTAAMQPLFEAISNAIHSVQSRFGKDVTDHGFIIVTLNINRNKRMVSASVEDNGWGLNAENWDAFTPPIRTIRSQLEERALAGFCGWIASKRFI